MKRVHLTFLWVILLMSMPIQAEQRWYHPKMVEQGKPLFIKHCAVCHGQNAEGTLDWRTADANGKYPPPPLNGTAHTWHHDIPVLKKVISEGGIRLGGSMPPFKGLLGDEDMNRLIAYFQSKWPEELYWKWHKHFKPETVNN